MSPANSTPNSNNTTQKCPKDLLAEAQKVLPHVYAPYSKFPVAAAVRTKTGKIFAGINVENASYSLTCCAEKNAISTMAAAGERIISEVLVLIPGDTPCPPCGACRQIIREFASEDCLVHICTDLGNYQCFTVEELLPSSFGPDNLSK